MRPTEYLGEWSRRDRGLAEGLVYLESATGSHGIPSWIAMDDEAGSWLEAKTRRDYAEAAAEQWRKNDPAASEPGAFPVIVDTRLED